jgi:hypothetical protein
MRINSDEQGNPRDSILMGPSYCETLFCRSPLVLFQPSVIFGCNESRQHGNFYPASYRNICAHPEWARRLAKVHTGSRRASPRAGWRWRELDCANSSDALLMNVFCCRRTLSNPALSSNSRQQSYGSATKACETKGRRGSERFARLSSSLQGEFRRWFQSSMYRPGSNRSSFSDSIVVLRSHQQLPACHQSSQRPRPSTHRVRRPTIHVVLQLVLVPGRPANALRPRHNRSLNPDAVSTCCTTLPLNTDGVSARWPTQTLFTLRANHSHGRNRK